MSDTVFHCQECGVAVKLDESLLKLNSAQLKLLIHKNHQDKHRRITENDYQLDPEEFIPRDRLEIYKSASSGHVRPIQFRNMIESEDEEDEDEDEDEESNNNDSENGETRSETPKETRQEPDEHVFASRMKTLTKIFEILSSNQQINHPLSADCAQLLIENYKLKFDQTQKEKDNYLSFLKKLKDRDTSEDIDHKLAESIDEYKKLKAEEKSNVSELKDLENSRAQLEKQLEELKTELKDLQENNLTDILKLKSKLQLDLSRKYNALEQAKASYRMHLNHLDKLRSMNIYTKMFSIRFDEQDKYGSINGFRLGYRIVEPEINAALGQIVMLLMFLTSRLNLKLRHYKLVPMGSRSQIIKYSARERTTVLNLYSSDEFSLGKLFNFNKLDVSLITLLDVVAQVEARLIQIDPDIELPYKISPHRDSIGGRSIRVTSKSEWTQACKFLLTDLNWILSYTSVHTSPVTL
ncbi:hypothetical protein PICST_80227 [Scheffersomyces stipitis CBS 6054]|uniref:Uncharacterized protein n=1 Tax=Scheffersomyces stipitis (strain ATCC 58785 / CBS 6054 / NBRC 10063 / NRRL Y-11545) TaxID=322104 RepID=A3GGG2_PICST|nr:predicted protein [Scheffersomyces stipitis CBS 6054]EAZ63927.2 hypothetical protein PICST_80227 [Scheffersomyces stipitis CBS 6054]